MRTQRALAGATLSLAALVANACTLDYDKLLGAGGASGVTSTSSSTSSTSSSSSGGSTSTSSSSSSSGVGGHGGAGGASSSSSSSGQGGSGGMPFTLAQGDFELYYGELVSDTPLVRTFEQGAWSASAPTFASGAIIKWIASPRTIGKEEELLVLSSTGANTSLDLVRRTGATTWVKDWTSTGIPVANANLRGFDVEQEGLSGDALAVFADGTDTPQWRARSGGAWSVAKALPGSPSNGPVLWIDLVSRPGSDQLALFYSDFTGRLVSAVWTGTAWSLPATLETKLNTTAYLNFGGAFEGMSGDLLAFWGGPNVGGSAALGAYSATMSAGSNVWIISAQLPFPFNRPGPVRLASEPGTDRIALAYLEFTCGGSTCDDFDTAIWDGNAWQDATRVDPDITVVYSAFPGAIPVDVAWVGTTGQAVAVYTATGVGIDWATWTPGAHWVLQNDATTNPVLAQRVHVRAVGRPDQSSVMFLLGDATGAMYAKSYDGSSWTDVGPALEPTLSSLSAAGPFALSLQR